MSNLIKLISLNKVEKKAFIFIFLISVLSLLSLIQADVLYRDDMSRVLSGNPGWAKDARPLSSFVSIILQLGLPLTDISPLSQILCLLLYSLSSVYLGKAFKINNLLFLILGGIIFVLNPFNLHNFSYVFDSFTMSLAVLTSTLAFFLITIILENCLLSIEKRILLALNLFLLVSSLSFYQAGISVYIAAFTFYSLLKFAQNQTPKKLLQTFSYYTISLGFSILFYYPVRKISVKGTTGIERFQIPALKDIPEIFFNNLIMSLKFVRQSLGRDSLLVLLILILGALVIFSMVTVKFNQLNKNRLNLSSFINLLITIILTLVNFFLLLVSFQGLSLIAVNPPMTPRIFMGFSTAVSISCFFLAHLFLLYCPFKFIKYSLVFFMCLLSLLFINISLTFGNLLSYQNTQEQIIATLIFSDLDEQISKLPNPPKNPKIAIVNQLKSNRLASNKAFQKYPILRSIIIPIYRQGPFGPQKLRTFGLEFERKIIPTKEKFIPTSNPILTRHIYDIYFENNDTFIIQFKKEIR